MKGVNILVLTYTLLTCYFSVLYNITLVPVNAFANISNVDQSVSAPFHLLL